MEWSIVKYWFHSDYHRHIEQCFTERSSASVEPNEVFDRYAALSVLSNEELDKWWGQIGTITRELIAAVHEYYTPPTSQLWCRCVVQIMKTAEKLAKRGRIAQKFIIKEAGMAFLEVLVVPNLDPEWQLTISRCLGELLADAYGDITKGMAQKTKLMSQLGERLRNCNSHDLQLSYYILAVRCISGMGGTFAEVIAKIWFPEHMFKDFRQKFLRTSACTLEAQADEILEQIRNTYSASLKFPSPSIESGRSSRSSSYCSMEPLNEWCESTYDNFFHKRSGSRQSNCSHLSSETARTPTERAATPHSDDDDCVITNFSFPPQLETDSRRLSARSAKPFTPQGHQDEASLPESMANVSPKMFSSSTTNEANRSEYPPNKRQAESALGEKNIDSQPPDKSRSLNSEVSSPNQPNAQNFNTGSITETIPFYKPPKPQQVSHGSTSDNRDHTVLYDGNIPNRAMHGAMMAHHSNPDILESHCNKANRIDVTSKPNASTATSTNQRDSATSPILSVRISNQASLQPQRSPQGYHGPMMTSRSNHVSDIRRGALNPINTMPPQPQSQQSSYSSQSSSGGIRASSSRPQGGSNPTTDVSITAQLGHGSDGHVSDNRGHPSNYFLTPAMDQSLRSFQIRNEPMMRPRSNVASLGINRAPFDRPPMHSQPQPQSRSAPHVSQSSYRGSRFDNPATANRIHESYGAMSDNHVYPANFPSTYGSHTSNQPHCSSQGYYRPMMTSCSNHVSDIRRGALNPTHSMPPQPQSQQSPYSPQSSPREIRASLPRPQGGINTRTSAIEIIVLTQGSHGLMNDNCDNPAFFPPIDGGNIPSQAMHQLAHSNWVPQCVGANVTIGDDSPSPPLVFNKVAHCQTRSNCDRSSPPIKYNGGKDVINQMPTMANSNECINDISYVVSSERLDKNTSVVLSESNSASQEQNATAVVLSPENLVQKLGPATNGDDINSPHIADVTTNSTKYGTAELREKRVLCINSPDSEARIKKIVKRRTKSGNIKKAKTLQQKELCPKLSSQLGNRKPREKSASSTKMNESHTRLNEVIEKLSKRSNLKQANTLLLLEHKELRPKLSSQHGKAKPQEKNASRTNLADSEPRTKSPTDRPLSEQQKMDLRRVLLRPKQSKNKHTNFHVVQNDELRMVLKKVPGTKPTSTKTKSVTPPLLPPLDKSDPTSMTALAERIVDMQKIFRTQLAMPALVAEKHIELANKLLDRLAVGDILLSDVIKMITFSRISSTLEYMYKNTDNPQVLVKLNRLWILAGEYIDSRISTLIADAQNMSLIGLYVNRKDIGLLNREYIKFKTELDRRRRLIQRKGGTKLNVALNRMPKPLELRKRKCQNQRARQAR